MTLMSSDSSPLNGENIEPRSMMTVSKTTTHMRPIKFLAVESATEKLLLINGKESVNVSPSKKSIVMPLIVSGTFVARRCWTKSEVWGVESRECVG